MSEKLHFRVSAGLKNIIGKELINDKFIAIFELVKNSYDAGAKNVTIKFVDIYKDNPHIYILDDGKGMSKQEIIDKWLFVAYSEKKNSSYRDNIKSRRNYAGAKGVGRFSCDRLGEVVELYSKTENEKHANYVNINWSDFEKTDINEFQNIEVTYDRMKTNTLLKSGTIINISNLREKWNRSELLQLKKSLTQLVNPDASEKYDSFQIMLDVEEENEQDEQLKKKHAENVEAVFDKDLVNGEIVNHVFEVLNLKTTKINVRISEDGKTITTSLNDRGIQLFEIEEKNKYRLKNINGTLYSLNRAAKINFTKMMGIESVNYGSVFIYKNGFRVYPYGEPEKDFMNIDRRKAQGYNRFLGTREISGRIDIYGENKGFIETSSRNNGFISSYETEELEDFFYEYMLKPLEKYVVNIIHWGEEIVNNESLASAIDQFDNLESVLKKIKAKFKPEALLNAKYNQELTNVISSHKMNNQHEIDELKKIAISKNDDELLRQAGKVEKETLKLKKEADENRQGLELEVAKHEETKKELETTQKQVGVLQSKADVTKDNAIDAMHIMKAYADSIDSNIEEIMDMVKDGESINDVVLILHEIRQTCSKIMNAYNLVINTNYKADTGNKKMDIVKFTRTYVERQWSHKQLEIKVDGDSELNIMFNPLEFSIIIDNIADNSKKANANCLHIIFTKEDGSPYIIWRDDGYGIDSGSKPKKMFEQGYTTTNGTGIGLFTVEGYIKKMNGTVTVNEEYLDGFEIQMRF